jgi:hypothetical protein
MTVPTISPNLRAIFGRNRQGLSCLEEVTDRRFFADRKALDLSAVTWGGPGASLCRRSPHYVQAKLLRGMRYEAA